MTRLLTAEEIAEQLQCSTDWIYGRLVRFDQQDVDRWIDAQKVNTNGAGPSQ